MKHWLQLLRETYASWSAHNAQRMGAALAFYTSFSLAPLAILAVAILSLAYEGEAARANLVAEAAGHLGKEGAEAIEGILENNSRNGGAWWSVVLGFVIVLFGASTVFGELQASLNQIWNVKPRSGWRGLVKTRLLSFLVVLALGVVLVLSVAASAVLASAEKYAGGWMPGSELLWKLLDLLLSFSIVTLLFAAIFKILPDERINWRDVWVGAAFTGVLFTLGKFLLGLYLGRAGTASAYGAAGSLILILLWVYYSAQILFFGAEFTRIHAGRDRGR